MDIGGEHKMAIAMALNGGLGIISRNTETIEDIISKLEVFRHPVVGLVDEQGVNSLPADSIDSVAN